ncbi:hypothetical protein PLESTB_000339700 [Pleodorina starrii]|uniref:Uncharacterized protein n=1 Tax=Pleodorina starrii TaxID=330485 RepID=A0A9W6BEF4_9CHLO|nr:hypothetical protein PLESTB_000339700 [Pleodorina starrii]
MRWNQSAGRGGRSISLPHHAQASAPGGTAGGAMRGTGGVRTPVQDTDAASGAINIIIIINIIIVVNIIILASWALITHVEASLVSYMLHTGPCTAAREQGQLPIRTCLLQAQPTRGQAPQQQLHSGAPPAETATLDPQWGRFRSPPPPRPARASPPSASVPPGRPPPARPSILVAARTTRRRRALRAWPSHQQDVHGGLALAAQAEAPEAPGLGWLRDPAMSETHSPNDEVAGDEEAGQS